MNTCEGCVAKTPEAQEIVEKVNKAQQQEDIFFSVDELANLFCTDTETAQDVLRCMFSREFNDCRGEEIYTSYTST